MAAARGAQNIRRVSVRRREVDVSFVQCSFFRPDVPATRPASQPASKPASPYSIFPTLLYSSGRDDSRRAAGTANRRHVTHGRLNDMIW